MIAAGTPQVLLPIDYLKANQKASIVELNGDESQVHRLAELGLRIGAVVHGSAWLSLFAGH